MPFFHAALVFLATLSGVAGGNIRRLANEECNVFSLKGIGYHNTLGKPSKMIDFLNADDENPHEVCIETGGTLGITADYEDKCKPDKVKFKLKYPNGHMYENTEQTAPFSCFRNKGDDIWGDDLHEGHYELTVFAWDNKKEVKNEYALKLTVKDRCPPANIQQTGFFYNDGATEGYTLFAPFRGIGTYLINNQGAIVHRWFEPDGLTPGASVYLTREGTLLKAVRSEGGGGDGGRIREYNKYGVCIWEFRYDDESSPAAPGQQHHDFEVLPDGKVLVLAREGNEDTILEVSRSDGKRNKNWDPRAEYPGTGLDPPDFDNTCKRVIDGASMNFKPDWKWSSADHRGAGAHKIDSSTLPIVNFNHIDYLPGRDHILISCNFCNEIFIIDHKPDTFQSAGEDGDLLWRWGTPSNYGASGESRLAFTHGAHWIYNEDSYGWSGFKDIGDVILFNNRDPQLGTGASGFSSVVQITPTWNDETQNYEPPKEGEAFGPIDFKRRVVQFSKDKDVFDIDSDFQGSAQLLPPGSRYSLDRILVTIGATNNNDSTNRAQGDIYELEADASGENAISVWRYVNPFIPPEAFWPSNNGPKPEDVELDPYATVALCDANNFGFECNAVFRGIKYAPSFDGIAHLH